MDQTEAKRLKNEINELKGDFRNEINELKENIKQLNTALIKNNELFFKASEQMSAIKNFAHHDLQEIKSSLKALKCNKQSQKLVMLETQITHLSDKINENSQVNKEQDNRHSNILLQILLLIAAAVFGAAATYLLK